METVQSDVTANMRAILVDWLVEVAEEYKLVSDTLFLTVSYIDRFLSFNAINRHRLQLLGVSSMLIASYVTIHFLLSMMIFLIEHCANGSFWIGIR